MPDPEVGAVVSGCDVHFSYLKIMKAASYLSNPNCHFIATSTDARVPVAGNVIPGPGALLKSIELCSERKPIVLGKPEPYIRKVVTEKFGVDPEKTLFIGDRYHCSFKYP